MWLSAYLSSCLSVSLPIYLSTCHLPAYLPTLNFLYLSLYLYLDLHPRFNTDLVCTRNVAASFPVFICVCVCSAILVCLCVCLYLSSIYLPTYLSIYLSIYKYVYIYIYIYLPTYLSIYLYLSISIYIYLSIYVRLLFSATCGVINQDQPPWRKDWSTPMRGPMEGHHGVWL